MTVATASHEAYERQQAARALLCTPLITTARQPELVQLVRRHAAALKSDFATQLGYHLIVESSFARLVKAPLAATSPVRSLSRPTTGTPLTPTGYATLALVSAALTAPGIGEQILISALVDQVRSDAASTGIEITDGLTDRRHLVAAVQILTDWGVLTQDDGSVTAWGERRQDEALLTINRALLPHLLAQPLYVHAGPHDAMFPDTVADVPVRRRLRRRLVEDPLVAREDLDDDERDALSRDRTDLTRQVEDLTGLVLEVRAEGALAYDPRGGLTDVEFPGSGTVKQAALLLLDEFAGRGQPGDVTVRPDGRQLSGTVVPWPDVDEALHRLVDRFRSAWGASYVDDPPALRSEIVTLLAGLGLVEPSDTGLLIRAAAARYRPVATTVGRTPGLFEDTE
jgi:uncharacterized protein (TIGR02678 family)